MIYIYGAIASGKSAYAEDYVCRLGKERVYLALMQVYGEERRKRVKKHRKMREGKKFRTVECQRPRTGMVKSSEIVLLECMSNFLANTMFQKDGIMTDRLLAVEKIQSEIFMLASECKELVIVGNDIFDDEKSYSKEVEEYILAMEELHDWLIKESQQVIEVIFGIAKIVKEKL